MVGIQFYSSVCEYALHERNCPTEYSWHIPCIDRLSILFHLKNIYEKPIVNIIPSSENLKTFPLTSLTRQRSPLLPLLFIVQGDLKINQ